mmetsp:Transcript_33322/g.24471  ORF Transcript_33322/g.24471 Transcript_33322/m.24471 type:complete len:96 (+) Transcript_33322:416-703(+)
MSLGTGLGMGLLIYGQEKVKVVHMEGGFMFVAANPRDDVQQRIGLFLEEKLQRPSSLGKIMKGSGILYLYQFLEEELYPELKNDYVVKTKKMLMQ